MWFDDAFKEFSDIIEFRSCRVTLVFCDAFKEFSNIVKFRFCHVIFGGHFACAALFFIKIRERLVDMVKHGLKKSEGVVKKSWPCLSILNNLRLRFV